MPYVYEYYDRICKEQGQEHGDEFLRQIKESDGQAGTLFSVQGETTLAMAELRATVNVTFRRLGRFFHLFK